MSSVTGAICGTFLCGEALAGELTFHGDPPELLLQPGHAQVYTADEVVSLAKPQLLLNARSFTAGPSEGAAVGKPVLILNTVPMGAGIIDPVPVDGKPQLLLLGQPFGLQSSSELTLAKPWLLLVGAGEAEGGIPLLTPTTPVDVILVPTTPGDYLLPPTEEEDLLLVPTTVRFI